MKKTKASSEREKEARSSGDRSAVVPSQRSRGSKGEVQAQTRGSMAGGGGASRGHGKTQSRRGTK